ncbi:MAG: hypothetical protein A2029_15440 [Chloroflexi bacterium RBG_19FT_COMBO_47_9]|nr:MAG: hypothetical protein A2029_15440 [Chloroflexi bacterium RBG_19FT_COMBO_47_9]
MPKVITSSVIRSAHQGESHGGVYLVDLETDQVDQVIDWDDGTISWEGRGGDRGLRGIALYRDKIYLASSDTIFVFDRNFSFVNSYTNRYLKLCHEIWISGNSLFLTSTGFDSILEFDLFNESFVRGYCLRSKKSPRLIITIQDLVTKLLRRMARKIPSLSRLDARKLRTLQKVRLNLFDPNSHEGPLPGDSFHINSVQSRKGEIIFSGLYTNGLFKIANNGLKRVAPLPMGTHNAQLYKSGVIFNWTPMGKVAYQNLVGGVQATFPIKRYPKAELLNSNLPKDHATQSFGRGLLTTENGLIIGGSSPATISVYQFGSPEAIKTITLTMDVRNAIHGLTFWQD